MKSLVPVTLVCMIVVVSAFSGCLDDGEDGGEKNVDPVASINADKVNVIFNKEIQFDGSSSHDEDGEIVEYTWNMGDGTVLTGETVTYSYSDTGEYTVKLTVKDDSGATDFKTITINVQGTPQVGTFQIDGDVSDWNGKVIWDDPTGDATKAGTDLALFSMDYADGELAFFATFNDELPGDGFKRGVLDLLLDADGDASTGYRLMGLGIDVMVQSVIDEGVVIGTNIYSHSGHREDTSGFAITGSGYSVERERTIEGHASFSDLGIENGDDVKAVFIAQYAGGQDISEYVVSPRKGALRINVASTAENPLPLGSNHIIDMTLSSSGKQVFLGEVEMPWLGSAPFGHGSCRIVKDGTVLFKATSMGDSYLFDLTGVAIDGTEEWEVHLNITGDPETIGKLTFGLDLSANNVGCDGTAFVPGPGTELFYLVEVGTMPTPDGCRGETDYTTSQDPAEGISMDILSFSSYARTDGPIVWGIAGNGLFEGEAFPTGYSSTTANYDSQGYDTLTIHFDLDGDDSTGVPVQGIGADFRITMEGREGRVTSIVQHFHRSDGWINHDTTASPDDDPYFVKRGNYLEGSFLYSDITVSNPKVVWKSVSWDGGIDTPGSPMSF